MLNLLTDKSGNITDSPKSDINKKGLTVLKKKEQKLRADLMRTALYVYQAIQHNDLESADLEVKELNIEFFQFSKMVQEREQREKLYANIQDLKRNGINVELSIRSPFFNQ